MMATSVPVNYAPAGSSVISQIAPGGNITSVVDATARLGWPHRPTRPEMQDVTDLTLWTTNPGGTVRILCRFAPLMGKAACVIRPKHRKPFRVRVRVWEDGSYRMVRG